MKKQRLPTVVHKCAVHGRAAFGILLAGAVAGCASATQLDDVPWQSPNVGNESVATTPDVYRAFGYLACKQGESCAKTFAGRVGVDLGANGAAPAANPRSTLDNPDPVWIPEWARLPASREGAHYAYEALALAAIHKSYRAECEKAYVAYDKDLTARLDKLDKAVAALNRDPNPYDRLGGLLKLEPPKPDKSRMHPFAEGTDPVRYRWESAVFEAFEDTKRTFVYAFDGYAPSDALLSVMHPRQPREHELDAFCIMAAKGSIGGIAPLPDTSSWDSGVRSMVKKFVSDDRSAQISRRRAELADVVRAKFAKVKVPNPQLPPGVREITVGKIQSFSRDGKKAIITSVIVREDRVGPKLVKVDDNATAVFDDWPSGVVLNPGDGVSFYGAETSVKEVVLKSTPELEHKSRQYQLAAKHVTKVVKGGKTTVYFR